MLDILEMIKHNVRVTEGKHKGRVGSIVALNFDTKTTPIAEVATESIIVDMISDNQKFSVPIIWIEIIKED